MFFMTGNIIFSIVLLFKLLKKWQTVLTMLISVYFPDKYSCEHRSSAEPITGNEDKDAYCEVEAKSSALTS